MIKWLIGLFGSWTILWLAGPWLLNSILVRVENQSLNAITFRQGDVIRWRTEGWATTHVGPAGLAGWQPNNSAVRVLVWGDSQVEGVCVNDNEKLGHQVVTIAGQQLSRQIDCVPFGRSGTDAADWADWMPAADAKFQPEMHFWLIAELADLLGIANETDHRANDRWHQASPPIVAAAKQFGAEAAYQSLRSLLLDPSSGQPRRIRLGIGPVANQTSLLRELHTVAPERATIVANRVAEINQQIGGRLTIVYACGVPRIDSQLRRDHPDDDAWQSVRLALKSHQVNIIDMTDDFLALWNEESKLPRGFHNGIPSYGHFNADGNRVIATAMIRFLKARPQP